MTTVRIYLVKGPAGKRLVEAATKAAAISHCVKAEYVADVAGQQALIDALAAGVKVEKAFEVQAPAEPPKSTLSFDKLDESPRAAWPHLSLADETLTAHSYV